MTAKELLYRIDEKTEELNKLKNSLSDAQKNYNEWHALAKRYERERDAIKGQIKGKKKEINDQMLEAYAVRDSKWPNIANLKSQINLLETEIKASQEDASKMTDADKYASMAVADGLSAKGTTHEAEAIKATADGTAQIIETQAVANVTMRKGAASAANKKLLGFILLGAGVLVLIALGFILYKKIKNNKTKK